MCFPAETIRMWTSQGAELEVDIFVVEGCDKAGEQLNNFRKAWITAAVNANGDAVVACSWFLGITSLYLILEFVLCEPSHLASSLNTTSWLEAGSDEVARPAEDPYPGQCAGLDGVEETTGGIERRCVP